MIFPKTFFTVCLYFYRGMTAARSLDQACIGLKTEFICVSITTPQSSLVQLIDRKFIKSFIEDNTNRMKCISGHTW